MNSLEQREHKRINLKLELCCRLAGDSEDSLYSGHSLNISTGGLLAQTYNSKIKIGDLVNIEMSVPPIEGLLDFGGKMEAFAKIVRITNRKHPENSDAASQLLAMQFCHHPKLSV
jgi:hypothetical protein